jgi:hypothetical protein
MARERWFYAPAHTRQGPIQLGQLVEELLRLPHPRSCLVWRRGLPTWMAAGEVGEIERAIAPFAPRTGSFGRVDPSGSTPPRTGPSDRVEAEPGRAGSSRAARAAAAQARPSPLIYAGAGVGVVVLAVIGWLAWPEARPKPPAAGQPATDRVISIKDGGSPSSPSPAAAAGSPAPAASATPAPVGAGGGAAWSEQEQELPPAEVARIRAIAAWSETTLTLTIYNGSGWRVTELEVRPSRLSGDTFEDDKKVLVLLPPRAVDAQVDQLLKQVAPDRRKSGLAPLDTGKFECEAGKRPEAFRAPIVGARGFPPR